MTPAVEKTATTTGRQLAVGQIYGREARSVHHGATADQSQYTTTRNVSTDG